MRLQHSIPRNWPSLRHFDAPRSSDSYMKTIDIPVDCISAKEVFVYMRRGMLEVPFSRILIPADAPTGLYALCVEDGVPAMLTQTSVHTTRKKDRATRATQRELLIAECEKALEEAIATAPPPATRACRGGQ